MSVKKVSKKEVITDKEKVDTKKPFKEAETDTALGLVEEEEKDTNEEEGVLDGEEEGEEMSFSEEDTDPFGDKWEQ